MNVNLWRLIFIMRVVQHYRICLNMLHSNVMEKSDPNMTDSFVVAAK